jgi:hypothetical protein
MWSRTSRPRCPLPQGLRGRVEGAPCDVCVWSTSQSDKGFATFVSSVLGAGRFVCLVHQSDYDPPMALLCSDQLRNSLDHLIQHSFFLKKPIFLKNKVSFKKGPVLFIPTLLRGSDAPRVVFADCLPRIVAGWARPPLSSCRTRTAYLKVLGCRCQKNANFHLAPIHWM